jgi:tetratricopeptide (TPR) repeat protein
MGFGADMEENEDLYKSTCLSLEVNVELVNVIDPNDFVKEPWEMSLTEKLKEANTRKAEGAELYKKGDFKAASEKYKRCIVLLESVLMNPQMLDEEHEKQHIEWKKGVAREKQRMEELRLKRLNKLPKEQVVSEPVDPQEQEPVKENSVSTVKTLLSLSRLNYAACMLKLTSYDVVIGQCTEVLKEDQNNVKALFRRAQAFLRKGRDLELAEADLDTLVTKGLLDKASPDLQREKALLKAKLDQAARVEKNMFAGVLK